MKMKMHDYFCDCSKAKATTLVGKLDSGRLVYYDACMEVEDGKDVYSFYDFKKWECIGTGVPHSCNGFISKNKTRYYFYRKLF